jgi:ATP-binding cassette, subfamily C (CFTR/MRP), member 5
LGGPLVALFVLLLFALGQGSSVIADWWLSQWSQRAFPPLTSFGAYFGIYAGIGALSIVLGIMRDFTFSITMVFASLNMHAKMLKRIMRAPMSFFDTTPMGRILNRFAQDMDQVDQRVGEALTQLFALVATSIGNIVLIAVALPWFLIALVPLSIGYFVLQQVYAATYRELRRLGSTSLSFVLSTAAETLTGLSTVRAYRKQAQFTTEFERRLDNHLMTYKAQCDAQRWLQSKLDLVGALAVLAAGMIAMAIRGQLDVALASLALTYALTAV